MFRNQSVTRRRAIKIGLSGLLGIGAVAGTKALSGYHQTQELGSLEKDFSILGTASLKQRAAAKGILFGAASATDKLQNDTEFKAKFIQECGILVPEWQLKWNAIRQTPTKFDFSGSDWLADFAKQNSMLFRGHTLVWQDALPEWFKETVNLQNAEKFLVEHINTVAKHYSGQVHSWDVVNEAISASDSNRPDGLSNSPWLSLLDKHYIELAFQVAAQADPKAMLVYNDRYLEYDTARDSAQRESVLKLLDHLKSVGTPVHALGIQAHLNASETRFNQNKFRSFLKDVANLGFKIMITELDVEDKNLPVETKTRDHKVASVYEDFLSVALDEKAVIAVITWGLSDRYTWFSKSSPRPDGAPVRPLPLDSQIEPKLAWNAIAKAFDHAPTR